MVEFTSIYSDGVLTLKPFKKDGQYFIKRWYIENSGNDWRLLNWPRDERQPIYVDRFPSLEAAYLHAKTL